MYIAMAESLIQSVLLFVEKYCVEKESKEKQCEVWKWDGMENLDFVRCWEIYLSIISKASANFNMRTRSPQIENDRTCIELK